MEAFCKFLLVALRDQGTAFVACKRNASMGRSERVSTRVKEQYLLRQVAVARAHCDTNDPCAESLPCEAMASLRTQPTPLHDLRSPAGVPSPRYPGAADVRGSGVRSRAKWLLIRQHEHL